MVLAVSSSAGWRGRWPVPNVPVMGPKGVPSVVLAIRRFLDGEHGPARGSRGLVAVSGGADSTALAIALTALAPARALELTIGHVDHGLRPTSDEDVRYVRDLAARLGAPFRVAAVSVDPTRAVEATARRERYRALDTMADGAGATWIATGHSRDDQVETLILRLTRGAGRGGIGGMRPRRGRILRPMLQVTRADVRWYLGDLGVVPREDLSNADLRFARNRVRHLILPLLERELSDQLGPRLAALADRLRDEDDFLGSVAAERAAEHGVGVDLPVAVRNEPLAIARRIVRTWLEAGGARGVGSRHVEAVLAIMDGEGGRRVSVPGSGRIINRGRVLVRETGPDEIPTAFRIAVTPGAEVEGPPQAPWRLVFSPYVPRSAVDTMPTDLAHAVFDVDGLPGPLHVRSVRPGDRMTVAGVGTSKLQDLFVDRHIPRARRGTVPVVASGDEIVWVPGIARSPTAYVGVRTDRVLAAVLHDGEVFGLPGKNRCDNLRDETRVTPARRR